MLYPLRVSNSVNISSEFIVHVGIWLSQLSINNPCSLPSAIGPPCLIKLPIDQEPIIMFNDECDWRMKPILAPGKEMQVGELVFLHEITGIEQIIPPMVDNKRVSFIFLFWNG